MATLKMNFGVKIELETARRLVALKHLKYKSNISYIYFYIQTVYITFDPYEWPLNVRSLLI